MKLAKSLINKYFSNFVYFYSHLRYRIFVVLLMSFIVGVLDGFGLAMFIPLLKFVADDDGSANAESMGNMAFLVDGLDAIGINLTLTMVLLVMLCFFILKGIVKFLEGYKNTVYGQFFVRNLREKNIIALANYSYYEFVKSDSGRIQNTMTGEIGRVVNAYKSYMRVIQMSVLITVYTFLAFLSNPQFAILVVCGGFLSNIMFNKIYTTTKSLSRKLSKYNNGFQGLIIQQVSQFKYLKSTGLIRFYAKKLIEKVIQIENAQRKIGILKAIMNGVREPMMMSVVVVVILVQVNLLGGSLSLIILSILFFYRSLGSVMALQAAWNEFLGMTGSLENLTSFTKQLNEGVERMGETPFNSFQECIELRDVTFRYGDITILKNISLDIKKNETIAFVGESGSGKTTLMNIISGLLKPDKGTLKIDGVDTRKLNVTTYQRRIGYITQEPVIFNDTIYNNVTFWDQYNPDNIIRFQKALTEANIDEYVKGLEKKEHTMLGNNGINLSGGQKQRISIARELYKDVDFLFMDEATSALDSKTEKQIQTNIDSLKGHYTIAIIAHRLSTIKNANRVVVMDKGEIQLMGNYKELEEQSVSFKRMVELQEV